MKELAPYILALSGLTENNEPPVTEPRIPDANIGRHYCSGCGKQEMRVRNGREGEHYKRCANGNCAITALLAVKKHIGRKGTERTGFMGQVTVNWEMIRMMIEPLWLKTRR